MFGKPRLCLLIANWLLRVSRDCQCYSLYLGPSFLVNSQSSTFLSFTYLPLALLILLIAPSPPPPLLLGNMEQLQRPLERGDLYCIINLLSIILLPLFLNKTNQFKQDEEQNQSTSLNAYLNLSGTHLDRPTAT